ncbi:MAG: FMN-binding protein [Lachnospiraceae bacterium]|nr:FMN-binding protein [Lachnospiraceae bacterium]
MSNTKKKIKPIVIGRRIVQIVSFLILPGLVSSIFYAMKEIYISVISGKFSFQEMSSQLLLFGGSIILTMVLGRFFCGFLCSFGAMGDLLWFLSQKTIKLKFKMKESTDRWLKRLKYVVLVAIILGIWTWNPFNIDSMASPWSVFGIYSRISGFTSMEYLLSIGGALLFLIIICSFFIERFFCRYLCPLGAVFAITSRLRIFHIIKKRDSCGSCRICTNKCSMGIPLYQYDTVTSGECINCFECTVHCPRKNAKTNAAPIAVSAVSTAAMFGLVYAGNIMTEVHNNNKEPIAMTQQTEVGVYIDGNYTGTGQGFRGEIKTTVTVENGNITDITVVSHQDDDEYFNRAKGTIISEIINNQDMNVDAVSGATFSSRGIMESVADALSITTDISDVSKTINSDISGNITESQSVEESQETTESLSETKDSAEYQDGIYTGTGQGFRGETGVSVTVENGEITDITIDSYVDDEQFFTRAQDGVIQEIIDNQDVNVDAVSGATFSSNGIKEAVANALGISFTNQNSDLKQEGPGKNHRNRG